MKGSPVSKTAPVNILLTERGSLVHKTLTFWGFSHQILVHSTLILERRVRLLKEVSTAIQGRSVLPILNPILVPGLMRDASVQPRCGY